MGSSELNQNSWQCSGVAQRHERTIDYSVGLLNVYLPERVPFKAVVGQDPPQIWMARKENTVPAGQWPGPNVQASWVKRCPTLYHIIVTPAPSALQDAMRPAIQQPGGWDTRARPCILMCPPAKCDAIRR